MTENERIKQVRKSLNLTLEAFGARVGVKKSAMSKIENGQSGVTEQMRRSVCREFGVSEEWLLTGEGEMFTNTLSHELDAAVSRYHLTHKDRILIEKYMELPLDIRNGILDYIERVSNALQSLDEQEQIEREAKEIAWQMREEREAADGLSVLQNTDSAGKMA